MLALPCWSSKNIMIPVLALHPPKNSMNQCQPGSQEPRTKDEQRPVDFQIPIIFFIRQNPAEQLGADYCCQENVTTHPTNNLATTIVKFIAKQR